MPVSPTSHTSSFPASNASPTTKSFTENDHQDPLASTMLKRNLTIADIMDIDTPDSTPSRTPEQQPLDYGADACNPLELSAASSVKRVKSTSGDSEKADVDTSALQHYFVTRHPHRHCSVTELLAYNKKWSSYMNEHDPLYFKELAKHQAPKFLWIGCADSRVPANEILGLAPGDVFVHRNVANVVYPSDLNCLACIQFGVEQLKIEHLIISGHYECGGVKAAYYDLQLGLVDNWVANIRDIKHRYWRLLEQVPENQRVATMCEMNAIVQARHVAESTVVQRWWAEYRKEQAAREEGGRQNVIVHGWIYGLADGLIVPLVELSAYDDVQKKCDEALTRCVTKRAEAYEEEIRQRATSMMVAEGAEAVSAAEGTCCGGQCPSIHKPTAEEIEKILAEGACV